MPRIDGARLCRFIKSNPALAGIPVVILSGILADEIEGLETINADAYVAKMPMDQLRIMLRNVFRKLEGKPVAPVLEGFDRMYRREVVHELLEERRLREVIIDSITEGIVELTSDRKILRTNRVFERMVGLGASDLLSLPISDVFGGASRTVEALFADAGARRGRAAGAVVPFQGRSLRLRLHCLDDAQPCDPPPNPALQGSAIENPKERLAEAETLPGFILLIEDVTDQVRSQEERERFREKLARSERMSALGMFASGAAHELNNPLTAVLGYAQLLGGKPLPPEVKANLRKIEEGATRCRAIVENLLIFSRSERPDRRSESINDLVREAAQECAARAAAARIEIRFDLAESRPTAEVNRGEVIQALFALLDNAIRAASSNDGGRRVEASTRIEGGAVEIDVADSGPGIPPRILGRIFDPFFGTREVGDGKGLGLSIAYGIARAHGGAVTARNLEGHGACLTLRLPSDAAGAEAASRAPASVGAARGGRILIVDDEPVVLDLLVEVLGGDHHIETAANGREGLARAVKEPFDIILLDIKMPDMTGRQMFEALVARRPEMAERVVFTTGDSLQEDTRRFLESVGNLVITKPFSLDAVTDVVDRLLAASRAS
jgi:signal transduction histidine kinase